MAAEHTGIIKLINEIMFDMTANNNNKKKIWKVVLLTWMTPSIMLTILLTMAMTLCVLSDGDMSGR